MWASGWVWVCEHMRGAWRTFIPISTWIERDYLRRYLPTYHLPQTFFCSVRPTQITCLMAPRTNYICAPFSFPLCGQAGWLVMWVTMRTYRKTISVTLLRSLCWLGWSATGQGKCSLGDRFGGKLKVNWKVLFWLWWESPWKGICWSVSWNLVCCNEIKLFHQS